MAMSQHVRRLRAALGSELLVLPSVTGIVYDERDRILLVRQSAGGVWSAPGGSVDPNETPADAVVREVWEETGLYIDPSAFSVCTAGRPVWLPIRTATVPHT